MTRTAKVSKVVKKQVVITKPIKVIKAEVVVEQTQPEEFSVVDVSLEEMPMVIKTFKIRQLSVKTIARKALQAYNDFKAMADQIV